MDHQQEDDSSADLSRKTLTPSDDSFPHFVDNSAPQQKEEDQFEDIQGIKCPTSGLSTSPSPDPDSEFGILASESMKPTEADDTDIPQDISAHIEEQVAPSEQLQTKEESEIGQDTIGTPVCTESLLARHETKLEQNEITVVATSAQLDTG